MDINVGMMGICLGAPLMLMMFFMKPGGRKLIFFLLMGFVACAVSDRVNIFLMENLEHYSAKTFTTYYAPVVEEIAKMIPILIYTIISKNKIKNRIAVGMSIGVGFGVLENVFYMITNAAKISSVQWIFARGFATALMHAICTAAVAYMLGMAYQHRKMYITGTLAAFTLAVTYHSIYNIMLKTDWSGLILFLPIVTYAVIFYKEHRADIKGFFKNRALKKDKNAG